MNLFTSKLSLIILFLFLMLGIQNSFAAVHYAGATLGNFKVSNNGSATYSIPLSIPPGINKIQPNLSLTYSSQKGNSLIGMGWGLSGLSSITRCAQTLALDGKIRSTDYTIEDRFCLNGKRLVPISAGSNEYRIIDSNDTKIIANGVSLANPTSFTVYTSNSNGARIGASPYIFQ